MTPTSRRLAAILLFAAAHAAFYIWYQQPDWSIAWTDQGGYRMLAEGIGASGQFTRYPGVTPFVPEALRTPGYPLFVAGVYTLAGSSQLAVAIAQGMLFLGICLMVFRLAGRVASRTAALVASTLCAAYAPLPYFGALVLTELWTTFVLTAAILATFRAVERSSAPWFAFSGFLLAYTALSRPVFILLVPCLILAAALLLWRRDVFGGARQWAPLVVAFVLTVLPWFAYNYRHFNSVTISPAGGIGRGLWESGWQGRWPGRVHAALTELASQPTSDETLRAEVERLAAGRGADVEPMLAYVLQWREIRRIWAYEEDPQRRFKVRIIADHTYLQAGLQNIRDDPWAFFTRRVVRGLFVLWAGEIPVRYTDINHLPDLAIRLIWIPQVLLAGLGMAGVILLARRGQWIAVVLLGGPLLYVTGVHFVLLTEARQSLPVKPLLIVAATVAGAEMVGRWRARAQTR
ncbi:MAG: ArnT family glycosyltransferase [Acidobacteriota bacterium]